MVQIPLPVEDTPGSIYTNEIQKKIGVFFWDQFFNKWDTYPAFHFHNGAWWARISAQVWNEVCVYPIIMVLPRLLTNISQISDFEYVAKVLNAVSKDVKETILVGKEPPSASS